MLAQEQSSGGPQRGPSPDSLSRPRPTRRIGRFMAGSELPARGDRPFGPDAGSETTTSRILHLMPPGTRSNPSGAGLPDQRETPLNELRDDACTRTSFQAVRSPNRFLKSRGFKVVKCGCGGHPAEPNRVRARPTREIRESIERHSERCPECKTRVRELLERIYGTCLRNHRFPWPAHLCHYEGTFIFPALRNVATTLEECRSFGLDDYESRCAGRACTGGNRIRK